MKIISVEMARAGIIHPIAEILPLNGLYPADITNAIAERYSFLHKPDFTRPVVEFQENGLQFQSGQFVFKDQQHNIQHLLILPIGLIAGAYSTDMALAFLVDLIAWARKKYGLRVPDSLARYFFLSQLVVQFERPMEGLVRKFEVLAKSMEKAMRETYEVAEPIFFSGLAFDYDRTKLPNEIKQLSTFAIERRDGKPASANTYFCQAPLHTQHHIQLLEELEAQLSL